MRTKFTMRVPEIVQLAILHARGQQSNVLKLFKDSEARGASTFSVFSLPSSIFNNHQRSVLIAATTTTISCHGLLLEDQQVHIRRTPEIIKDLEPPQQT